MSSKRYGKALLGFAMVAVLRARPGRVFQR